MSSNIVNKILKTLTMNLEALERYFFKKNTLVVLNIPKTAFNVSLYPYFPHSSSFSLFTLFTLSI